MREISKPKSAVRTVFSRIPIRKSRESSEIPEKRVESDRGEGKKNFFMMTFGRTQVVETMNSKEKLKPIHRFRIKSQQTHEDNERKPPLSIPKRPRILSVQNERKKPSFFNSKESNEKISSSSIIIIKSLG